jgi:hypothetical protein
MASAAKRSASPPMPSTTALTRVMVEEITARLRAGSSRRTLLRGTDGGYHARSERDER